MKRYALSILVFCGAVMLTAQQREEGKTPTTDQPTISAPTIAQQSVVGRPVARGWELTDEERVNRRVRARGRIRSDAVSGSNEGYRESIDGRMTPELFMRYELFDHLLLGMSSNQEIAKRFRAGINPKIHAFGYDENEFWATLSSVALSYQRAREGHAKSRQGATAFQLPNGRKSMVMINRDDCTARIEVMEDARHRLGGQRFDRFLYSVVAPGFQYSEGGSGPGRAEQLLYMARGCK